MGIMEKSENDKDEKKVISPFVFCVRNTFNISEREVVSLF